jgi:hypothetical protein
MLIAPCVPSAAVVENIARFVVDAGYTEEQMTEHGLTKVPWRRPAIRSLLNYKIPSDTSFNLLLRLFWFGEAVSLEEVSSLFPRELIESLLICKMLGPRGGERYTAMHAGRRWRNAPCLRFG